jgi:lipid-A-disaccharide synthase-like uncharacterized protein
MQLLIMEWFASFAFVALITLNPWQIVGLLGSVMFGSRFVLQWIASERARKSIIPIGFWEISLAGNLLLLSYFVFYRRDSVGIITNLLPLPMYLRNLYLKWCEVLNQKKAATAAAPDELIK